jgi:hypothetical protein
MTEPDDDGYGDIGHNQPPTFAEEILEANKPLVLRLDALKLERDRLPAVINTDAENATVGKFVTQARALTKDIEAEHKKVVAPYKEKANTIDEIFLSRGFVGEIKKLVDVVQALANDYAARKEKERRRQLEIEAEAKRQEEEAKSYEAAALQDAGSHSAAEVVISQGEHAAKMANRLEAKAQGSAAQVLRTAHDGVTASGRTKWTYEITDLDKVDLNVLRDAIYGHELQQIIQRFVDGGGRELPGVRIYEKTIATFR